jgi:4-hydroxy-tetrahydrodipicolinate synthase
MPRFPNDQPAGVIPAVLLPFQEDLSIDEASFKAHLTDIANVEGISTITVNAHSTEVASCTADEQCRVMEIAGHTVGDRLPIVHGACGPTEASRRRPLPAARHLAAPRPCWCFRRRPLQ